jgi:hypothetical protein
MPLKTVYQLTANSIRPDNTQMFHYYDVIFINCFRYYMLFIFDIPTNRLCIVCFSTRFFLNSYSVSVSVMQSILLHVCDRATLTCPLVTNDGYVLQWDYGHLTVAGSRAIVGAVKSKIEKLLKI